MTVPPPIPDVAASVNANNPWLGLASFTEETRAFFFGREEETNELARRVQRKLLTVLFGQSGLGKTSILRAGLVPKLAGHGYFPVYVRIDYGRNAPEPAEQIKQAISNVARASGKWTQAGVAVEGESLWEFLHHRDDVLLDEQGQPLVPLLIFDQFEEIFTLAQGDEFGRARAARFVEELADLVENRPPRKLEASLEQDGDAAERFDFSRSDYRVLISLREDYLAPLESLKRSMPSLAQNRLRLAPMTGTQALAAVLQPGGKLVTQEVAEAIVRFVAGGAELANAEVEPSLLSLICRELNDARVAQGRSEISLDLLAGSHATILSNFYERALADQPAAVRQIIEDDLLTESGYRENIAEENLVRHFATAGAPATTLATLVNRRLLRIEERLDVRRVELTHDVLCSVVKASRDERHERERLAETDRVLAEQRERELAARRGLRRARKIAAVCTGLAVLAIGAAVFAVFSTLRARRAESATQQARVQAEALVGYLSDDFARQLETYGQLQTISDISRRQIDYFHGLPASLKGFDSIRNGGQAMVAYARAERSMGHSRTANDSSREAIALLDQLRLDGDTSDATIIALSAAYSALAQVLSFNADAEVYAVSNKALELIEPLATKPGASEPALRAYARALISLGYDDGQLASKFEEGVKHMARARGVAASMGARELKTLDAGALYVAAAVWEAETLNQLGRNDEARDLQIEADGIARRILAQRPAYRSVVHDAAIIELDLGAQAGSRLDLAQAEMWAKRAWELSEAQLRMDPDNSSAINNASVNLLSLGDIAWARGDVGESFDYYSRSEEIFKRVEQTGAWFVLNSLTPLATEGQRRAEAGDLAGAKTRVDKSAATVKYLKDTEPAGSHTPIFGECSHQITESNVGLSSGDFATARSKAIQARALVEGLEPSAPFESLMKFFCVYYGPVTQGEAELWLGDPKAANQSFDLALGVRDKYPAGSLDEKRALSIAKLLKGIALVRLGKVDEARALISPQVAFQKGLVAQNKGDTTLYIDYAKTLYAQSLIDPANAAALRAQALALIDRQPATVRALNSVKRWRALIQRAS